MKVRKSELVGASQLYAYVGERDFLDCYSVELGEIDAPIEEVVQRLFLDFPAWIQVLLDIRDFTVRLFGLKTTAGLPTDTRHRSDLKVGDYVNFFKVVSLEPEEIIVGEDDSHLDFRIAIRKDQLPKRKLSLSTWVRPHNMLGRLYLQLILPFHILIVKSRLKGVVRALA